MNQPIASVLHGADNYGLRPEASEFPMMLVLSFVYPCNALCPHCPYTNSNIRKEYRDAPYMPESTFKRIADESGQYGAYLRISGGGEPMLHPQATELLVYAKNVGCKIGLITNGSLFDEASSRALLDAGVDMIEFSVDACDPQTYAVVRKGLEWDILVEAAKRMLSLRNARKAGSKIVASAVAQEGVDIDAVEKYWVDGIGMDYLIKRKFLTWGTNTTLDPSNSADPAAYLNTDEMPCPFIFERLNIVLAGTSWFAATISLPTPAWATSTLNQSPISGMAKASNSIATSTSPAVVRTSQSVRAAPTGSIDPGNT